MKQTSYSIQIKNPCQENWENMTPTQKGKYCDVCTKQVIDFRKMSDAQIAAYLLNNANGCGIFAPAQLYRSLPLPSPTRDRLNPFKTLVALLLVGTPSLAQQLATPVAPIGSSQAEAQKPNDSLPRTKPELKIYGKVVDESDEPLIGVAVLLLDSIETVTDGEGAYTLVVPAHFPCDSVTIRFSYGGMQESTHCIETKFLPFKKNVVMIEDPTLDPVVVIGYGTMGKYNITTAAPSPGPLPKVRRFFNQLFR